MGRGFENPSAYGMERTGAGNMIWAGAGMGENEDIAQAALFLASDDARFFNGATLPVDGGFLAY